MSGVTPEWDEASGSVLFLDRLGRVKVSIPPGFMTDSTINPASGLPARSNNVKYTLVRQGVGWALQVDLDEAWLNDPARVYPVVVDPAYLSDTDDTFVSSRDNANRNNSAERELQVGTYDNGGEKAASYLHFSTLIPSVANKYVYSAALNLWNNWSYSCGAGNGRSIYAYKVTQGWSASTTKQWPGPT